MQKLTLDTQMRRLSWIFLITACALLIGRWFVGYIPVESDQQNEITKYLTWLGWGTLALGFACTAGAYRQEIGRFSRSRQAKYGGNMVLFSIGFVGFVGLLNYMSSRYHTRWDLTEAKSHSLSEQTKIILGRLEKPIKVLAFYQVSNPQFKTAKDLLNSYQFVSDKLSVEFVDPDKQPSKVREYQVERYGTVVFDLEGKREKVNTADEQSFTSALLKLTKNRTPKVYFLEGHGELSLEDSGDAGLGTLKRRMEQEHYKAEKLYLTTTKAVPKDCDVLVVAGPKKPLLAPEVQAVDRFLAQGGKALILSDPTIQSGLEGVLVKYGLTLRNDMVVDPTSNLWSDPLSPVIGRYRWHEITKGLTTFSAFPRARSVEVAKELPPNTTATPLAETSPQGWGETQLQGQLSLDPGKDHAGPVAVAAAISQEEPAAKPEDKPKVKTRLVVFGNSTFVSNPMMEVPGNSDLFLNSVAWLSQEPDLIGIRPKPPENKSLNLTNQQFAVARNLSLWGAPALVLLLGGGVWYRRKNL